MASEAMFIWIRRCVLVRTIHRTFASTWRWQPRIMPSAGLPRRSDTAAKAVQQRQGFSGGHRIYVASLAQVGQIDEARTALDRLTDPQPKISVAWIEQNAPWTVGPMPKIPRRNAQGG
jgi:hypothetical protein